MTDPAVHAIENFVLTFLTAGMVLYLVVALACVWTDREYTVGRTDRGRATPVRPIRRQP